MNCQYKQGDKLVLELINSDEILEGEYVNGSKDRVTLVNINSYKSSHVIKGPYSYYRSDISFIKILNEFSSSVTPANKTDYENEYSSDFILITKLEYELLKLMSQKYIYMTTMDSRYYKAIESIKNCETIGIGVITTNYDRTGLLNLLCISTSNQIYVLDFLLMNLQRFPSDLKEVLECKHVRKVLHDSRLLTEILTKRFHVKLTNIFDTKVADIVLRKKNGKIPEYTRNLSECLVHYFNFPTTLMGHEDANLDKWKRRPLSDLRKFKAAQMVTFLITLKNHLEHLLLKDFYKTVDDYSKSLQSCCMTEVAEKLFDKKLCNVLSNINLK